MGLKKAAEKHGIHPKDGACHKQAECRDWRGMRVCRSEDHDDEVPMPDEFWTGNVDILDSTKTANGTACKLTATFLRMNKLLMSLKRSLKLRDTTSKKVGVVMKIKHQCIRRL